MAASRPILVTGTAGFIGFHLARRLLDSGRPVVGVDCVNDYYDVRLKEARLELLSAYPAFRFHRVDLADKVAAEGAFREANPARVVHLAAQAGVRYSLTNPDAYIQSNLVAFSHILELCRHGGVEHLVYASSSSVYGANGQMPFEEDHGVDHPVSLYAATKRSNELMAHAYSHLFRLPTTGLRFFTVYGPWGRPDMALFLFTRAILEGKPIDVFRDGQMIRDFTFIDDIVEGVVRVLDHTAEPDSSWSEEHPIPATSAAPFRVYNIGNHQPVVLIDMIRILERALGREATIQFRPMQPGDVVATCASVERLKRDTGFSPDTPLEVGIQRFVEWYREFYRV